jgi:UDP-glucose 4-epimerase
VEVIEHGYNVVILDNLTNSSLEAIRRMESIVGKKIPFEKCDLTDLKAVKAVFAKYPIDSVIHFAALKVTSFSKEL